MADNIILHDEVGFQKMRAAGKLAASVLDYITDYVNPGVTTNEINDLCHKMILENGAIPAPLNYKGFPKSVCTSINHVVCHGIPSDRKLLDGEIINIDVTVILDGWYGDTSRMYFVGKKTPIKAKRLVDATYTAMMKGIEIVKPGVQLCEIGRTIQNYIEGFGYSSVREYCGHGIGQVFHTAPSVLHYYDKTNDLVLKEGMFFTVEPMINIGDWKTRLLNDEWTVVTKDNSLSAQFEHSIGVTKDGYEIFTQSSKNFTKPPY
ncbi:MAG: methionyl aminopeptidase [Candidatus Midichloriaceae bacterium]|jgi:methionyl aminopeptidase